MRSYILPLFLILLSSFAIAQPKGKVIDEVVAVIGENIILQSDIDMEFAQLEMEMPGLSDTLKCDILDQKLIEKLLLFKAQVDSVVVTEERVEAELDKRIRYFVAKAGGEKNLEEYYGKSILEIKTNNRDKIREQMLVQEMQSKILKDVKVSPTDVKNFYNSMPKDSLPYYDAEVQVAQIIILPKVSPDQKKLALEKITGIRDRILKGEDFNTLALIYSDDPASAAQGGELGYFSRGDMVSSFEAAAFRLKGDTISKIIETNYGYHILKLIDRRGESINIRHILVKPLTVRADLADAKKRMDSIYNLIKIDSISFTEAAKRVSDHEDTKSSGGFLTEANTGSNIIPYRELDKSMYSVLEGMKAGDVSEPTLVNFPDGQQGYRILFLKSETEAHVANLKDDYQKLQVLASQHKQQQTMETWIKRHRAKYYISVSSKYRSCGEIQKWIQ